MSKILLKIVIAMTTVFAILSSQNVYANGFNPNLIISDNALQNIPTYLSSAALIQSYLNSKNSLLANYQVLMSFDPSSDIINPAYFTNLPYYLQPAKIMVPYTGKYVSVAEFVWMLSTQDLGNSCSLIANDICANNKVNTINPAFILTMIQKESGLVYGPNSQLNPNNDSTKFLLDRVLGYYCFETSTPPTLQEKQTSCYDENPNWKYFKGFFRQMYYGVRFLRIHEQMCRDSRNFGGYHNNNYKVGKTVNFNGINVLFENGMTCSMYLYTPHVYNSQYNSWNIFTNTLNGDKNLIKYISEDTKLINFGHSVAAKDENKDKNKSTSSSNSASSAGKAE